MLLGLALALLLFSGAGDRFSRKPVALAGAVGVTIAGLSSALATQFWQLAALRGLVGVFMGIGIGPCVAITCKNVQSLFDLEIYSLKLLVLRIRLFWIFHLLNQLLQSLLYSNTNSPTV